jgi:hypothetical protein
MLERWACDVKEEKTGIEGCRSEGRRMVRCVGGIVRSVAAQESSKDMDKGQVQYGATESRTRTHSKELVHEA